VDQEDVPQIYSVVRETWLTRKPRPTAQAIALLSWFVLALGCAVFWRDLWSAQLWMPATQMTVYGEGEFWRLWTTLFAHADLGHLAANSLLFYILGYFLCGYFGTRVFPGAALVFGGLINAFALLTYHPGVHLIGASGVVSWMGGVWLTLYLFINTKLSYTQRSMRAFGVALLLFAPAETFDPKVSYRTHMIGFVIGVLCGLIYYFMRREKFRAAEVRETRVD
jgi:rhomboid protease GluP